jgi:hypothetical protein
MKTITKIFASAAVFLAFAGNADAQVYATSFSNYNPGPLADGVSPITAVRPQRSNPASAVGAVNAATNDNNQQIQQTTSCLLYSLVVVVIVFKC